MSTYIHPTAIIYPNVYIGENVYIGAYSVIGSQPEHPGEVDPRDWKPKYDESVVFIDNNVVIREFVTIHAGLIGSTHLGSSTYIMAHSHIGHDSFISRDCVLHSACVIGGHSLVSNYCRIGLNTTLHQHTQLAQGTMVGAQAFVKGTWRESYRILAGVPAKDIGENIRLKQKLGLI